MRKSLRLAPKRKKEPMTQGASTRGVISVPGGETEKKSFVSRCGGGPGGKVCGCAVFSGMTVRFFTKLVVVIHPARKRSWHGCKFHCGLAEKKLSSAFSLRALWSLCIWAPWLLVCVARSGSTEIYRVPLRVSKCAPTICGLVLWFLQLQA